MLKAIESSCYHVMNRFLESWKILKAYGNICYQYMQNNIRANTLSTGEEIDLVEIVIGILQEDTSLCDISSSYLFVVYLRVNH